jgi:hypothetical protein
VTDGLSRFYGFWICLAVGAALNIFAWVALWVANYEGFAVLYSLGNITALCAAGFFTGPARQVKGSPSLYTSTPPSYFRKFDQFFDSTLLVVCALQECSKRSDGSPPVFTLG